MSLTDVNLFRIDGSIGSVSNVQTSALNNGPLAGSRNRIINGDMRIDQRNNGASVSTGTATAGGYSLDRWGYYVSGGGAFSIQRSTIAPSGFTNSLLATVTTADPSIASGDQYQIRQVIEGFNGSDFGWGAAGASAVTLSFWVRSSVTGTFSVSVRNHDGTRSYVATYAINAANTWEYKTLSIAGDTSGTWLTDNSVFCFLTWCMGAGSSSDAAAGSWSTGNFLATSASVDWIATNGATFYITGVQLEPGTVATPFERRSYGQELALCQRYYQTGRAGYRETYPKNAAGVYWYGDYLAMRAAPTGVITSTTQNDSNRLGAIAVNSTSVSTIMFQATVNGSTGDPVWGEVNYSVSSEL